MLRGDRDMKKKAVAVLMTAVMAMGMVSAVSVQAGIEDKTLIVGFDAEYPPYGYMDDDGEYTGFDLELAQAVCDLEGWELEKKPINFSMILGVDFSDGIDDDSVLIDHIGSPQCPV